MLAGMQAACGAARKDFRLRQVSIMSHGLQAAQAAAQHRHRQQHSTGTGSSTGSRQCDDGMQAAPDQHSLQAESAAKLFRQRQVSTVIQAAAQAAGSVMTACRQRQISIACRLRQQ
jgi:hypothetical protein